MRVLYTLTAAVGLVTAAPWNLDIAGIDALELKSHDPSSPANRQGPTYNTRFSADRATSQIVVDPLRRREAASRREMLERTGRLRRAGNCAAYSQGSAPKTSPDTAEAFLSNPVYTQIAINATTPQGYNLAFHNLNTSVDQPGYMGSITYQHYNTLACQHACDAAPGCTAFNMYIERSPALDAGAGCPNPPAVFNYRCTLWGLNITTSSAVNSGQFRGPTDRNGTAFHTVITASNGYTKNAAPPSYGNFTGPVALAGAIQEPQPADLSQSTYIGQRSWPGIYDPAQCASACQATTAYDKAFLADSNGNYKACNFFNSFVVSKDGVPQGTTCYFFTKPWEAGFAKDVGQYDQRGRAYTVSSSYAYTLAVQDPGVVSGQ